MIGYFDKLSRIFFDWMSQPRRKPWRNMRRGVLPPRLPQRGRILVVPAHIRGCDWNHWRVKVHRRLPGLKDQLHPVDRKMQARRQPTEGKLEVMMEDVRPKKLLKFQRIPRHLEPLQDKVLEVQEVLLQVTEPKEWSECNGHWPQNATWKLPMNPPTRAVLLKMHPKPSEILTEMWDVWWDNHAMKN